MSYENELDHADEKVDLRLWKRLFSYSFRNKKLTLATIFCLMWVAAIDSLYPLFANYAVDEFIVPGISEGALRFSLIYVAACFLQGIGTFGFISLCGKTEMNISYQIRKEGFEKLQLQSFAFYDNTTTGYLMARMVSDVSRLSEMIAWSLVDVLWSLFYALFCVVIMFMKNWKLALIVISVIPILAIASNYLEKAIRKYQRQARKHNSRITGAFNEGIMGAVTTKTLVREEANAKEFSSITDDMEKASLKASLLSASFFPVVTSLGAIGTALALCIGGKAVISGSNTFLGMITAGSLVAFINYASNLFDPIQNLASILADFQSAQAAAERVIDLLDSPVPITDSEAVTEKYGDTMHPRRENWEQIIGDINFKNVGFHYTSGEPVLTNFSLHVTPGETVALVGETGAGKSTIVNLACRFYEPTEGVVEVDGIDYKERSQLWLQSSLGYVLQTPHLFSGTIRENIAFGRPDASLEEVKAAAKMVSADTFIEKQEKGYDTEVGEGGSLLSTGQKQLICFARVILADPKIFVLDEATSSIDTETEQLIQNAIAKVLTGRTSLVVAHRLSTVRNADRILVIDKGGISEEGSHEKLMQQRGAYYRLYMNQFMNETIEKSSAAAFGKETAVK